MIYLSRAEGLLKRQQRMKFIVSSFHTVRNFKFLLRSPPEDLLVKKRVSRRGSFFIPSYSLLLCIQQHS